MKRKPEGAERDRIIDEMLSQRLPNNSIASRLGVSPQRVDQIMNERRGLCWCGRERVFEKFCEKHASQRAKGMAKDEPQPTAPAKTHHVPVQQSSVRLDKIYLVTVMAEGEKRTRCWGWYRNFDDAERAVMSNATDIFEIGYYDLAVIEEMPEGVMAMAEKEWWYRAAWPDGMSPSKRLRSKPVVEKIKKPEKYKQVLNFSIG